jgi:hypothetical protein
MIKLINKEKEIGTHPKSGLPMPQFVELGGIKEDDGLLKEGKIQHSREIPLAPRSGLPRKRHPTMIQRKETKELKESNEIVLKEKPWLKPLPKRKNNTRIDSEAMFLCGKGSHTSFSVHQAGKICELLAEGLTLTRICRLEGMPSYPTVMRWLWEETPYREEFQKMYEAARKMQAECYSDQIIDLADDRDGDYTEMIDKDGNRKMVFQPASIQRSRLQCDVRRHLMESLNREKYGKPDKSEKMAPVHVSGGANIMLNLSGEKINLDDINRNFGTGKQQIKENNILEAPCIEILGKK